MSNTQKIVNPEVNVLNEEIAKLRAKLAEAQANKKSKSRVTLCKFTHKKSGQEKVGINVQLGQGMPKFFYASQLQELLGMAKEIEAAIEANKEVLSWKE